MPTWSKQLLNIPNTITLARLPLFGWFVWEAALGNSALAFGIFLAVWALDWVDGAVARGLHQTTRVGYYLDKVIDRFVMVAGVVVMIRYGILPAAALLLMARDIGYLPAAFPVRALEKNWRGAHTLGKITTFLQGLGFVWLYFAWPYPAVIVGATAIIGGITAIRHLRQLMVVMALLLLPLSAHASVILSELMWDGVEYVEFYNNSSDAVSLVDWKLTRQQADGEEKTIIVFSDNTSVSGEGYFLLEKNEDATTVAADAVASALTLVNTGELVRLYDAGGNVVDTAGQFGAWVAGKNTDTGIAMERGNPTTGGFSGWYTSSGSGGGRGGTPRAPNSDGSGGGGDSGNNQGDEEQSSKTDQEYSTPIVINEFLPNPEGDDAAGEFIELFNPSMQAVDLSGWQLDDAIAGSKVYTIPSGTSLAAHAYAVFTREQTGIALNNTGDDVHLLDPNGTVQVRADYSGSVPDGQSYNYAAGGYQWSTTLTPGSANVITEPVPDGESQSTKSTSTKASPAVAGTAQTTSPLTSSVIIFRALPNPVGDDAAGELIELKNVGTISVNLSGWQLDDEDGGSAPYVIPNGVNIAPAATLTFSREDTGIALNNNGDTVRLLASDGTVVDELAYVNVAEGEILEAGDHSGGVDTSSTAPALAKVAGTQQAAAFSEDDSGVRNQKQDAAPQAIAQLTGGDAAEVNRVGEISSSNKRGILGGIVLVLGAGVVAVLSFGDKDKLLQWVSRFVSWRQP